MLGKITNIEKIRGLDLANVGSLKGSNGASLGLSGMINAISGYGSYDGYLVETTKHKYHILIENGHSCCEEWGFMISEDEPNYFINNELLEVRLTDTALNQARIDEKIPYGLEEGSIQFVDFATTNDVFQIAVYNSHNGYYGHSIIVAKDGELLLSDVL